MPSELRSHEDVSRFRCVGVNLSRDSKLKITKDLLTHDSRSHTPLNSRLKITQQLLTHPNSSESRDALAQTWKKERRPRALTCAPSTVTVPRGGTRL
jgi:hypothetical protein